MSQMLTPMRRQADHAQATATAHLPAPQPLTSTSTSTSTSTPSATSTSALSSSPYTRTPNTEPYQSELLPHGRPRLTATHDLQRITPRATNVPDPKLGYWHSIDTKNTKMGKPHSGGFKPLNTISKSVTYGRKPSSTSRMAHMDMPGHARYLNAHNHVTGSSPISPDRGPSRVSGEPSPAKRRKTVNSDNHVPTSSRHRNAPIEIEDDDDDVQLTSSRLVHAPVHAPVNVSFEDMSTVSTPRSNGSLNTVTGSRSGTQSGSEFKSVVDLTNPHRKRSRKGGVGGGAVTNNHPYSRPGRTLQDVSVVVDDDSLSIPGAESARKQILEDFQQKSTKNQGNHMRSARGTGEDASHHFPKARVNESTSDVHSQVTNGLHYYNKSLDDQNLRTHRRSEASDQQTVELEDDRISYSSDELARPHPLAAVSRQDKKQEKITQTANSGAKRKVGAKQPQGWALECVRQVGVDWFEGLPGTQLLLLCSSKPWKVVERSIEQEDITKMEIDPDQVWNAQVGQETRIRLESRRNNSGQDVWDLKFDNPAHYRSFVDTHIKPLAVQKNFPQREEEHMEKLFNRSLQNVRPAASPTTDKPIPPVDETGTSNTQKKSIWNNTGLTAQFASTLEKAGLDADMHSLERTSTRPTRSTRTSGQSYDEERTTIEKYSVDVGLGPRWDKPVQFGTGRRRAVVNHDDLSRLDEDEFLNDSLIDFYMIYLFQQFKVPSDKVFFFNTYFYTALTKNTGRSYINYDAVKRWTARDDIFSHDYIVVPINEDAHWYLAIICNVSNIARKPIVEDFDDPQAMPSSITLAEEAGEQVESAAAQSSIAEMPSPEKNDDVMLMDGCVDEDKDINLINPDDAGTAANASTGDGHELAITEQDPKMRALANILGSLKKKRSKRKPVVPKRDPNNPVIVILDSLGLTRSNAVRALKDWLKAEGMEKRAMEVDIKEKGLYPKSTQIPMQDNFSDCGVFVLGYARKFMQDPDAFKTRILTGNMSAQTDWPDMKPKVMRADLRNLLFDMHKKQAEERRAEYKAKKELKKKMPLTPATSRPAQPRPTIDKQESVKPNEAKSSKTPDPKSEAPTSETLPKSRLGSPFEPEPQRAPRSRSHSPAAVMKVSDSPPIQARAKPSAAPLVKRESPEVIIQVNSHLHNGHTEHKAFGGSNGAARRLVHPTPPSLPVQKRDRAPPSSPVRPRTRQGSSDHPIEIADSQEQPAPGKPATTLKRTINIHSVQTIPRPPRPHQSEGLVEQQPHSETTEPPSDPMDIDSQPVLEPIEMLVTDMDIDEPPSAHANQCSPGSSIRETPTPERSSPAAEQERSL